MGLHHVLLDKEITMDITQLTYFVAIVENRFNLSMTSKKLHLSQPALTQYIRKFEDEEKTELFIRSNGRLIGLTNVGENFYTNAKIVLAQHERMLKELRENTTSVKGSIRIGIPPLILTVLFTEVLAQLITRNPAIRFDVLEEGAFDLRKKLILHEIDFAILLQPSDLNPQTFKEDVIHQDELTAFMSIHNPLAQKKVISWSDLKHRDLAIFSESFMIHHQLLRKFSSIILVPQIALTSSSWDFLLESTRPSDFITILPSPIRHHMYFNDVVEVPFDHPISWHVILAYPLKSHYNRIETYTRDSILNYFLKGKAIDPISIG